MPLLKYNSICVRSGSSVLPVARQNEIEEFHKSILSDFKKYRISYAKHLFQAWRSTPNLANLSVPAWSKVSKTHSALGYRLIVGFKTTPCQYRNEDRYSIGCFNCGYFSGSGLKKANDSQIFEQFQYGIEKNAYRANEYDVIEFLSDGSFLDDRQISPVARKKLFIHIRKMTQIKRVLIESTPEHVCEKLPEIEIFLEFLRCDQELEIGIGLETSDDFIRKYCINKGFKLSEYEMALESLGKVALSHNNRLRTVSYLLIKPAFLSDNEAVKDIVSTLVYLADVSERKNIEIIPKLEPAAIASGTLLAFLNSFPANDPRHYSTLNYWAVLEILTQIYLSRDHQHILNNIRIGAREDMDDVIRMPAIYRSDGRFAQLDFILYSAIQEFNQHSNVNYIFSLLNAVSDTELRCLLDTPFSLGKWISENSITNDLNDSCSHSAIKQFLETESDYAIPPVKSPLDTEVVFLKACYKVLDILEGYTQTSYETIKAISKIIFKGDMENNNVSNDIAQLIENCFRQLGAISLDVRVFEINIEKHNYIRIYFAVKDRNSDKWYEIWSMCPDSNVAAEFEKKYTQEV